VEKYRIQLPIYPYFEIPIPDTEATFKNTKKATPIDHYLTIPTKNYSNWKKHFTEAKIFSTLCLEKK